MNNYLAEEGYKGALTRDELYAKIRSYWETTFLRIHDTSCDLAEAIVLIMDKHRIPFTQTQLVRTLEREGYKHLQPTRWSVKREAGRLEGAGIIIFIKSNGKNTRYWLAYEVINDSIEQEFQINEELRHIDHILTRIGQARRLGMDQDFGIGFVKKFQKLKDVLTNIQQNISALPEIDQAVLKINKLLALYRHLNSAGDFKRKENTLFLELVQILNNVKWKLKEVANVRPEQ